MAYRRSRWKGPQFFVCLFFLNHDVDPCCEGQRKFLPKLNLVWNETFFLYQGNFSPLLFTSFNKNVADDKTAKK